MALNENFSLPLEWQAGKQVVEENTLEPKQKRREATMATAKVKIILCIAKA